MKSAFKMFLNEISQYPLLSASEERELARRFKDDGDEDAREQLINCNLRLVVSISYRGVIVYRLLYLFSYYAKNRSI